MSDGGPAFPHGDVSGVAAEGFGMSLRDYFAAKCLQGLISNENRMTDLSVAMAAYAIADAMVHARALINPTLHHP